MQNKDRFSTLQEAQREYFKVKDKWLNEHKTIFTFDSWLFMESEEKTDTDYEAWHNIIVED